MRRDKGRRAGKLLAAPLTRNALHATLYSLEGAIYGIYSDAQATKLIRTITTDATGYGAAELEYGNYWLREISAPKG